MDRLRQLLETRFGSTVPTPPEADHIASSAQRLAELADHTSHRWYRDEPVSDDLLRLLAGVALSAPSKSDLQQRDIIIVTAPEQLARLKAEVSEQAWTENIPALLVFCGNNRRQRQLHDWRGHPFVNDHLDAFFNAAVDAGIALQAFITAAETAGLGCCPLSAIRNNAETVSDILQLPDHCFPVAGLGVGWPAREGRISYRLPLETTVHMNRFDESGLREQIAAYDTRRAKDQPFRTQRETSAFGELPASDYTWSEDKARQYARPERADFGAFVIKKLFNLT